MQLARQTDPIEVLVTSGAKDQDRCPSPHSHLNRTTIQGPQRVNRGVETAFVWIGIACCWLFSVAVGCTPPRGMEEPAAPPAAETPQPKAPASTAYGKALEAADRLKSQAQDYNDRLEKLSDPTVK